MAAPAPSSKSDAFAHVLKAMLRPLVRAMIAHGVTAPRVYRLLKELYVEVADADFRIDGARPTDSRVHVLTGVHRKDVKAIRTAGDGAGPPARRSAATITTLVGRWLADPETTGPDGAPSPLPRSADAGPSFERLAAATTRETRPRTLLDELLRQKLVTIDPGDGLVRLRPEAVVGPADFGQRAHFFGENLRDHIAAATDNLLVEKDAPPFLERAVYYNNVTRESAAAIEAAARSLSVDALSSINRIAYARQRADEGAADATFRIRFGVFFHHADESEAGDGAGDEGDDAT